MQALRFVLSALTGRPDVIGALVISDEGLLIESSFPGAVDPEAAAALTATALRQLAALHLALGQQPPELIVLEGSTGLTILNRLHTGAILLVQASPDGDLSQLLYDLRRHSPALTSLV